MAEHELRSLFQALREYADALDKDRGHDKSAVTRLMREAADEIEHLREQVNSGRSTRESLEGLPKGTLPRV